MPDNEVIREFLAQFQWISETVEAILKGKPIPPAIGKPKSAVGRLITSLSAVAEQYRNIEGQIGASKRKEQVLELALTNINAQLNIEKQAASNASLLEANLKRAERRIDDLISTNQALKGHLMELTKQRLSSRGESLFEQSKEETQALLSMLKAIQLMDSILPQDEVIKRACQIPIDFFGCQRSAAFLWDNDSASFIPVYSLGLKASLIAAFGASHLRGIDLPVFTQLLAKGSTLAVENCRKAPTKGKVYLGDRKVEFFESASPFLSRDYIEQFEIYSLLAVPFTNKGAVLGVMFVDYGNTPHEFSVTEIAAMDGLGQCVGTGLDNIRRQQTATQRVLELQRLNETKSILRDIDAAVSSIHQPEPMIGMVIGMIPRVIACDWVSVLLYDKPAGGFYVLGNLGNALQGKGTIPFEFLNWSADLKTDRIIHRANLETESRTSALDLYLMSDGIRSDLFVPISLSGETIGFLHLCSRRVAGFVQEDMTLAQDIARRLGDGLKETLAQRLQDRRRANGYFKQIQAVVDHLSKKDSAFGDYRDQIIACGMAVARQLDLDEEQMEWIKYAIALNGIGNSTIPEYILKKKDNLTPKEMAILRTHPTRGAEMIKNFRFSQLIRGMKFTKFVAPMIRHLYEHWDGTGYPEGLKGEAIPIGSRIVAVANAYAAMTNDRPYRQALSKQQSLREIQEAAGTLFDPRIVAIFLRYQKHFPN